MKNVLIFCVISLLSLSFIKTDNVIEVDIYSNETVIINGDRVNKFGVCDSVCTLLLNHNFLGKLHPRTEREMKRVVVSIYNERSVSYDFYIAVNNEIEKAYSYAWNTLAQINYNQEFKNLDTEKKREIKNKLPKVISEADAK